MKEVATSFAQLADIIMIMITLAVSSAAVAQWAAGGDVNSSNTVEIDASPLAGAQ
jgi:hypothetical protein